MDPTVKLHSKNRYFCGTNAEVEGDIFKFKGASHLVGVVKIAEPMSPILNYFEYEIIDKGLKAAIGIGVGENRYPLDRMPGWNKCGIGYHADDGRMFHENGFGKAFGPLCTTGDRMGCGLHFDPELENGFVYVFFTRNGSQVKGLVKMKIPLYGLYPLIGLHSAGEKVHYLGHWRRIPDTIQEPMETDVSPQTYWLRSNGVRYREDGLTLEYDGEGLERQDVGTAQANCPLSSTNHYFELEILDCGLNGWIAIGLAKSTYPLTKHPGWCEGSVGYHADNGHLYKGLGQGEPFGSVCSTGDVMGCGVRFSESSLTTTCNEYSPDDEGVDHLEDSSFMYEEGDYDDYDDFDEMFGYRQVGGGRLQQARRNKVSSSDGDSLRKCTVYFTRNSELVGETECPIPKGGFYPLVAMLSVGEKIRVNLNPLTG